MADDQTTPPAASVAPTDPATPAGVDPTLPPEATQTPPAAVTPDPTSTAPSTSPDTPVQSTGDVAPSTTGSGSGAAPDQTSGAPLTGTGPEHATDAGLIAPPSSTPDTSGSVDAEQLAKDNKKAELQTTADVLGVDVPSGAKKADIAEAIVSQSGPSASPVTVDNRTRRSSDDALLGSWVDVISGPLTGRWGAYVDTVHHDPESGYPSVILIRSRDEFNQLLEVAYSDVRPSTRNGGR